MFICDRDNAATEYAMLSALFGVGRTIAIAMSGYLAQELGFARYYWLTAALALPGLMLIPMVRQRLIARVLHEWSEGVKLREEFSLRGVFRRSADYPYRRSVPTPGSTTARCTAGGR